MSDLLETAFASVDAELDRSVESLFALVRVPSVSSDPAYAGDCRDAATMLSHMLEGLGFSASVRETAGHPCVIAHLPSKKAGVPKVLFYGHYDVQPAEPFETWQSPPFDPVRVERDGATSLVGRGMADDKGQMWTFFQACQALLRTTGELPVDLTVLVEGEEEAGSASLEQFLRENRDELACDVAFVCDSSMWDEVTPAITCSLKGLLHERVTLIGPNQDLHSGLYGGVATNPLRVMARVLSALHDADGKVAIPGFYDGVREVAPTVLGRWRELEFSAWDVLSGVGLSHSTGEAGRTVLEQLWARPAIDINGINGGNAGPGERSVLPSVATARLSIRLVDGQDPQRIRALFREFISRQLPEDCSVSFAGSEGYPAIAVPEENKFLQLAVGALSDEWGRQPVLQGTGGAIPAVRFMKDILGVDSVMVGFGLSGDAIHAPNENYGLERLRKGARSWVRILEACGRVEG